MKLCLGTTVFHSLSRDEAKPMCAEHPCLLGSTNPCPPAVHMFFSLLYLAWLICTHVSAYIGVQDTPTRLQENIPNCKAAQKANCVGVYISMSLNPSLPTGSLKI